jgi:hypothetical protein
VGEKTELRVRVDAEGADVEEVAELTRRQLRRALLELDVDAAEPVPGGQALQTPKRLRHYPMITQPGKEITWGELHVGSRSSPTPGSPRSAGRPSAGS